MVKDELKNLITEKTARIGVIGLGYVGLPLIIEFALKGYATVGFEVDAKKVDAMNQGTSHIVDVPSENVQKAIADGKFSATTDFSELKNCDVIIICVPTPLRKTKDPDMSYILAAGEQIKKYARRGQLVILESTTYPGTTRFCIQTLSIMFTRSARRGSPKLVNCGKTLFVRSISEWRTKWRRSATRSASTAGKLSAPPRPNRSALCRFIPDPESAGTAFRSIRII